MKKSASILVAAIFAMSVMCGCKNDWTISELPPVPEKADGNGYVSGFDGEGSGLIIPVEVAAAGDYNIVVRGRAASDAAAGTGIISAGESSANLTFDKAYQWTDVSVKLSLKAGVNDIDIAAGPGNGLFEIDDSELK